MSIDKDSYTCPHCKERQTTVIEWQTGLVGYERSAGKAWDYVGTQPQIEGEMFESYACPNCKGDVPSEMVSQDL